VRFAADMYGHDAKLVRALTSRRSTIVASPRRPTD
jgi:hypothetical protein